jgi:hypothetical protein
MKTFALIATFIAATFLMQDKPKDSATKIKELKTERIVALRDVAKFSHALFRNARIDPDRAYSWNQILLNAELEVAENEADRIKLYEKFVETMKEYEAIATTRKQGAQGTEADVLKAKVLRLEGEIALEQAKAKAAK